LSAQSQTLEELIAYATTEDEVDKVVERDAVKAVSQETLVSLEVRTGKLDLAPDAIEGKLRPNDRRRSDLRRSSRRSCRCR
jgi:hypothetical protein